MTHIPVFSVWISTSFLKEQELEFQEEEDKELD